MPKVIMSVSTPGSIDGTSTNLFLAGQEYDLPEALANAFVVHMKVAAYPRKRTKPPATVETAVEEAAPEIEDEPAVPEGTTVALTEEEAEIESGETLEEGKSEIVEAKNTRVYALARELKTGWETVIEVANKLGIEVKAAAAGLTDSEVKKIKADFEK